jgi:hypothetical protein
MKMRKILLLCAIPLFTLALPACDSPDDEADLQALDIEDDAEVRAAAEVQTAENVQGAPASGLELDVITNAPHPVAAQPNQLCRTNSPAILYTSPTSGIYVPPNALVRILDYAGPYHYLARYAGTTGQLERSRVIQESCYYQ